MTNGRPQRQVLGPALRRFWVIALLAGLVAGITSTWAVLATSTTTWSAQATYIVPLASPPVTTPEGEVVQPNPRLPTNPVEAARYAQAYAVLLREDPDILTVLAEATGLSPAEAVQQTEALPVPDSSVLRVSFSAGTEEQVRAYFDALDVALTASPAVSANIPAGNLRLLREADASSEAGLRPVAPVIGVLVGLAVALGLAVLLERLDPRLRSSADVREIADWPVLDFSEVPGDPRTQLLAERALQVDPGARSIVVVGVAGMSSQRVHDIATHLEATSSELQRDGSRAGRAADPEWLAGTTLAGDGAAERSAQEADVVVLLAPLHSRLSHLTRSVQSLQELGTDPVLVALVPREARFRSRPRDAEEQLNSWFEQPASPEEDGVSSGSTTADRVAGNR